MENKIQLLNPDPSKKGAVIDHYKYEIVKETILNIIDERGTIAFKELMGEVAHQLSTSFDGSPSWYCTAVKLDLEARGIIKRMEGSKPQKLQMAEEK
ncbi:hypothetical protein [Oceanobacillus sp. J11TS1]|uniref:DUF6958 family protein n=1 Tax=Oceanobacillus sp. J11TS1 TaxID=2807191 RepID=UPI001B26026E|nr:hypothetical protein [Oceanobacillus sp. J11TS1]GIO24197.1 hypothetical protein J11TS1_27780 [Oceanobacillus sp. J11TS1]